MNVINSILDYLPINDLNKINLYKIFIIFNNKIIYKENNDNKYRYMKPIKIYKKFKFEIKTGCCNNNYITGVNYIYDICNEYNILSLYDYYYNYFKQELVVINGKYILTNNDNNYDYFFNQNYDDVYQIICNECKNLYIYCKKCNIKLQLIKISGSKRFDSLVRYKDSNGKYIEEKESEISIDKDELDDYCDYDISDLNIYYYNHNEMIINGHNDFDITGNNASSLWYCNKCNDSIYLWDE